ncbi:hypothetical protein DQ04_08121010 [Trypanosoma grayi]|uniref:hypothetical protein n=1 Tax=Trypanosoma grayi TaxID=71804 RepID=UPI0004F4A449|nr:hypothetical protein DQ04_08121010 [Trypanosoma grayi]KEG08054.1 hypothetical protein DQ04_08121010 [Trypanosoma grayi]
MTSRSLGAPPLQEAEMSEWPLPSRAASAASVRGDERRMTSGSLGAPRLQEAEMDGGRSDASRAVTAPISRVNDIMASGDLTCAMPRVDDEMESWNLPSRKSRVADEDAFAAAMRKAEMDSWCLPRSAMVQRGALKSAGGSREVVVDDGQDDSRVGRMFNRDHADGLLSVASEDDNNRTLLTQSEMIPQSSFVNSSRAAETVDYSDSHVWSSTEHSFVSREVDESIDDSMEAGEWMASTTPPFADAGNPSELWLTLPMEGLVDSGSRKVAREAARLRENTEGLHMRLDENGDLLLGWSHKPLLHTPQEVISNVSAIDQLTAADTCESRITCDAAGCGEAPLAQPDADEKASKAEGREDINSEAVKMNDELKEKKGNRDGEDNRECDDKEDEKITYDNKEENEGYYVSQEDNGLAQKNKSYNKEQNQGTQEEVMHYGRGEDEEVLPTAADECGVEPNTTDPDSWHDPDGSCVLELCEVSVSDASDTSYVDIWMEDGVSANFAKLLRGLEEANRVICKPVEALRMLRAREDEGYWYKQ